MKRQRFKQFAASFLVVLALVSSSFAAACRCAPHEIGTAEDSHCQSQSERHSAHRHSHEISAEHRRESAPENVSVSLSANDECCCAESAPRVFIKGESIKIEKQTVLISSVFTPVETFLISP